MPSLHALQEAFVATIMAPAGATPPFATLPAAEGRVRIGIYRNAIFANFRRALAASFPVVEHLVGIEFFTAAVDAYVRAYPSTSGDLNVYGNTFGDFLARFPPAGTLGYLPDVARLEWAIDEARRAADVAELPDVIAALATIAPERRADARLRLDPSCRFVASAYPVRRIWEIHQPEHAGADPVSLDEGAERLLVRRRRDGITIEQIGAGEEAFLQALHAGETLGAAIDAADRAQPGFDLGEALHAQGAGAAIVGVLP